MTIGVALRVEAMCHQQLHYPLPKHSLARDQRRLALIEHARLFQLLYYLYKLQFMDRLRKWQIDMAAILQERIDITFCM